MVSAVCVSYYYYDLENDDHYHCFRLTSGRSEGAVVSGRRANKAYGYLKYKDNALTSQNKCG